MSARQAFERPYHISDAVRSAQTSNLANGMDKLSADIS